MKKTRIAVLFALLLVFSSLSLFATGAKEVKDSEKLVMVESVVKENDGATISGIFEDGQEVIIHTTDEETASNTSISELKRGDVIAVVDNGIMTMSLPPQIFALSVRNITPLVKSGQISVSFPALSPARSGEGDVLEFATINSDDLISEFNYAYGCLIMQNLIANSIVPDAGYFARGINDLYRSMSGENVSFLVPMEEMNTLIQQYVDEYMSQGIVGSAGLLYTNLDQINALEKPETLPLTFAYSYGVLTTLDLLSYGYDIVGPDYIQGLLTVIYGFEPIYSEEEMGIILDEYVDMKDDEYASYLAEMSEYNLSQANAFLAEQAQVPGVKTLQNGVLLEVIHEDSELGAQPTKDDTVIVSYTLTLLDGTVADYGDDVSFPLAALIPGFTEACTNMKVGQTAMAYIPPELGYGESGAGTIPPNSLLIFEIQLQGIEKDE